MEIRITDQLDKRIDKYLAEQVGITRSAICVLINDKKVKVNNLDCNKNYIPKIGDIITLTIPEPKAINLSPQDINLDIVYEDNSLLVVNKPRGMVVHPAAGNYDGTLVNALLAHCGTNLSSINNGDVRPGIIHRLDKDTSGLLIVAKTNSAHVKLALQIKEHSFLRIYNGIVYGKLKDSEGIINLPIGRHPKNRKKMAVTDINSKPAITHYKVIEELGKNTLMEFKLKTGRTHQIRVHMSHMNHAIIGDSVYSPKNANAMGYKQQLLHAKKIGFIHPETGEYMEFDSDLPLDIESFITKNRT